MNKDPHFDREAQRYENPIASREFILTRMNAIGEPVSFKRLARELNLETQEQDEALKLRLRAMVRDGQIATVRNQYAIANKLALIAGRVSAHRDGYGFVICDEDRDDIFLPHRQMRSVFHGDRVLVRLRGQDRRGRDEGEIVEVLERNTTQLVGRVYFENSAAFFEALNRHINHEMFIQGDPSGLKPGQVVVARVVDQPSLHGIPGVEVTDILGEHLTPELEVEVALRNNDIPFEFSDEAIEEADRLPMKIPSSQSEGRYDLRELDFVTIDGEDARDFDDAVYCEARKDGWRLYVAIADVAHYVKEGSALDGDALARGTSVYFPQYVVPMLPEKLSNGLCSLRPGEDRLVLVCEMTISSAGRVGTHLFYEGIIHSRGRLTYNQVGKWLEQGRFPEHAESLTQLAKLYKVLVSQRKQRGAVDFDTTEVRFSFDKQGRVKGVHKVIRNDAHKIIEECMLCANVSAARLLGHSDLAGLYRVHEKPELEKITWLREFLASLECELPGGDSPQPTDFQSAARQLSGRQNSDVLQVALLRAMQQAVYQPKNLGHFGLAYKEYAHFTSPIRRYPDLTIHRLIKALIHARSQVKGVERPGSRNKDIAYSHNPEQVAQLGEQLSFAERRADAAVYEVLEWIKCDFVSEHVGDDFQGVITGVSRFGIFVQLNDLYVEGLVHVSTLTGDYYNYDQATQLLEGSRTRRVFGMGDLVTVQVARVDVDERMIDLELLSHSPIKRKRVASKQRDRKSGRRSEKGRSRKDNSGRSGSRRSGSKNDSSRQSTPKKDSSGKSASGKSPSNKSTSKKGASPKGGGRKQVKGRGGSQKGRARRR